MNIWKWDPFEEFLSKAQLRVHENEFNIPNDATLSLKRDNDYKINLRTIGSARKSKLTKTQPLGTIYRNDSLILLHSHLGNISLHSVDHTNSNTSISQQSTTTDTFSIEKICFISNSDRLPEYTIEHIANLPDYYIWPDIQHYSSKTQNVLKFEALPDLNISSDAGSKSASYSCLHIIINDDDVIIGKQHNAPEVQNAGFIFYRGQPAEELRRSIRDALSFAFGVPLIYFGHTSFTLSGSIISLEAITPHTMQGRAWKSTGLPPAPITSMNGRSNQLDKTLLQRIVQGFVSNSGKYNIAQIPWRLWYAETAVYFMKPAYYGALIEGIQKAYLDDNSNKIDRTIISKATFKRHRKPIEKYIRKICSSELEIKLLTDKLNNSNVAPQRILASRFYSHLGLSLGPLENDAWNNRNDAAHGNSIAEDNLINYMRDTKILRIILNRIILNLIDASDFYVDGYTIGHAVRLLSDHIPEEDLG